MIGTIDYYCFLSDLGENDELSIFHEKCNDSHVHRYFRRFPLCFSRVFFCSFSSIKLKLHVFK